MPNAWVNREARLLRRSGLTICYGRLLPVLVKLKTVVSLKIATWQTHRTWQCRMGAAWHCCPFCCNVSLHDAFEYCDHSRWFGMAVLLRVRWFLIMPALDITLFNLKAITSEISGGAFFAESKPASYAGELDWLDTHSCSIDEGKLESSISSSINIPPAIGAIEFPLEKFRKSSPPFIMAGNAAWSVSKLWWNYISLDWYSSSYS